MPNWCDNVVEISGTKEQIDRVQKAFAEGRLCDEFLPIPEELKGTTAPSREDEATREALIEKYGAADWYDFCVNNWGTKWDVGGDEGGYCPGRDSDEYITLTFQSAWAPPTGIYPVLEDLGMTVRAYYYEPGCAFAGIYEDGYDECYSLEGSADEVEADIPESLDEMFGIVESMREYEEENEE